MIFQWELKWYTFCRTHLDQTWKIMHYPTDLEEKCITPKGRICTSLLSYFSKIDYFYIISSSFSLIYASSFYKWIKYLSSLIFTQLNKILINRRTRANRSRNCRWADRRAVGCGWFARNSTFSGWFLLKENEIDKVFMKLYSDSKVTFFYFS